jgi:hypothetical protein
MERRRNADEGGLPSLTWGPGKDLPPSNTDWAAVEAGSTEEVDARALADPETPPREPEAANGARGMKRLGCASCGSSGSR